MDNNTTIKKRTATATVTISAYFFPGDRVRLKHRPDIKGTVIEISSWHGYNDVVWTMGREPRVRISEYHIGHDGGGGCITSMPDEYELDTSSDTEGQKETGE